MQRVISMFAVVGFVLVGSSCGGVAPAPGEPQVGSLEQAAKACPFAVPFCPADCKLTGHCPQECKCPPNTTICGQNLCEKGETCCSGQPFPQPTCIAGPQCPISRREYKTDINYLGQQDLHRTRADLMKFRLATWRYKTDGAQASPHLGFIIDDVEPSPAIAGGGQMVDLYGYTSMAVAALQAQSQEMAALKQEMAALKAELHHHKSR